MSTTTSHQAPPVPAQARQTGSGSFLLNKVSAHFAKSPVSFEIRTPDGAAHPFGPGPAEFRVLLHNAAGQRALTSLDEGRFAEAYLAGDIDLEGDMLKPFALRQGMGDAHLLTYLWRFVQPLVFGQVKTNRAAISSHYDIDPKFFLSLLDPKTPCYTQGVYESDDEGLDVATTRKFEYCFNQLGLKAGDHILEIGPGWGAWFEYASARGVKCTGISISQASIDYLTGRAKELGRDWELIFSDLLAYRTDRKYDAIVIMGVIEHLPQYDKVLAKFQELIKPNGKIFLDGSACTKKYELSSFMVKYIYPGNHSFLVLHDFLDKLAQTPMKMLECYSDRWSYYLTFRQWAINFDNNKDFVIQNFGAFNYRRFRLYLWGAAYEFYSRSLECYRLILHMPGDDPSVGR